MILSTNPVGEDNWTFLHFFKDERNKRLVLDDQIPVAEYLAEQVETGK